jgi:hypothetical protein
MFLDQEHMLYRSMILIVLGFTASAHRGTRWLRSGVQAKRGSTMTASSRHMFQDLEATDKLMRCHNKACSSLIASTQE